MRISHFSAALVLTSGLVFSSFSWASSDFMVITGDLRGHFLSAEDESRPGAARLLSAAGEGLRVDAGNMFFSHHQLDRPLEALLAAPEALVYDVVHLTWMDLAFGARPLKQGIQNRRYQSVSANLQLRDSSELLGLPYALVEVQGKTIAITGLTGLTDDSRAHPEMARVFNEVNILDPEEVLTEMLPELRSQADQIMLLFAGDNASLYDLQARFGNELDYLVAGFLPGMMNDPLPEGVINARGTFGHRAVIIRPVSSRGEIQQEFVLASDTIEASELVAALYDLGIARAPGLRSVLPDRRSTLPRHLPSGAAVVIEGSAESRAHRLLVRKLFRGRQSSNQTAPEGLEFLVLTGIAENRKPRDLIGLDRGQEAVLFGHLNEVLVLVHDNERVIPLHREQESFEGALPLSFTLPAPRSRREGDLVFLIPEGEPSALELRHYHIEYEPLFIPLLAGDDSVRDQVAMDLDRQRNDFFEFGVVWLGSGAGDDVPGGLHRVELDLNGRSTLTRSNPAVHYRRSADPEERVDTGRIVPFRHARDHLFLVSEEGFVYPPRWELSTLAEEPYFLPDLDTSGRLVFDIPDAMERYRFSIYYPNIGTATGGRGEVPHAMHFDVLDIDFAYKGADPLIDFGLEQLRVVATALERSAEAVVVEIEVFNETSNPGFWPMESRLGLTLPGAAAAIQATRLTDPHEMALPWRAHLPPGEPRRMQLHFEVPPGAGSGELHVSGLTDSPSEIISWDEQAVRVGSM